MDAMTFRVHTDLADRKVDGGDTTIVRVPERFYVDVGGQKALNVRLVGRQLRQLAEEQAAALGEKLHHAEFVITTDPAIVQSHGNMHPGCDTCETGIATALGVLRQNPAQELLVGQLFWASDEQVPMPETT